MTGYSERLQDIKTRPQVAAPRSRYSTKPLPTLCVVYHPDASMLGARCFIPAHQDLAFGRELEFADVKGHSCFPLLDPYISRELGAWVYSDGHLTLLRRAGASNIQYQGRALGLEARFELTEGYWHTLNCSNRLVLSIGLEIQTNDDLIPMDTIVGRNPRIVAMRSDIRRVAATDDDVLITGPTGAGKEGVATELHRFSQRRTGRLVAVNMAALPLELAASELFGAEKGAYTGANTAKQGYFRQTEGGTLFLDEIGDAAPELQAQLLRALQMREIQVLGGSTQNVDVRVVAATEQSIQGDDASLRAALYHRLSQQRIEVPPLGERLDDVGLLAHHYFHTRENGPWAVEQDDSAIAAWCQVFVALMAYHWPGNVRELFAVLGQITLDDDYPVAPEFTTKSHSDPVSVAESPSTKIEISDDVFLQLLEDCDYEVARLAQQLSMSRPSIYRRRDKLGVPKAKDYSALDVESALKAHGGDVTKTAKALRVSVAALLRLHPELGA